MDEVAVPGEEDAVKVYMESAVDMDGSEVVVSIPSTRCLASWYLRWFLSKTIDCVCVCFAVVGCEGAPTMAVSMCELAFIT